MKSLPKRAALALTAVAVTAGTALVGAPAQAAATSITQIRPADIVPVPGTVSGTTGSAKAQFLAEGIHIQTDNTSDGARAYYLIPGGVPLADVHTVDYEWFGTPDGQPAMTYNIDIDGDGKPDAQLMGEAAYGGKDVWLNRDSEDFSGVTPTVPAGYFTGRSPCSPANVPQNGNVDGCGASGDPRHGTLDDWVRSLSANGKTAKVVSSGYIAIGLVYNGVLRSQTVGPKQFTFTNLPKSTVTVTAAAKKDVVHKANKVKVGGAAKPVPAGATVALEVRQGGAWVSVKSRALAAAGTFRFAAKPVKVGTNRFRVTVTETNSTLAAKSATVKVKVTK